MNSFFRICLVVDWIQKREIFFIKTTQCMNFKHDHIIEKKRLVTSREVTGTPGLLVKNPCTTVCY